MAGGPRPEVFVVDLEAVLGKNDTSTDVKLQPYDQIYIGETRGATVARCLPPWMKKVLPGMSSLDAAIEMPKDEGR